MTVACYSWSMLSSVFCRVKVMKVVDVAAESITSPVIPNVKTVTNGTHFCPDVEFISQLENL